VSVDLVATLPKTRRRKPLPPGFKVALAQVLWCHAWVVYELFRWFDAHTTALIVIGVWVGLAWMRPRVGHTWWDVAGCVHWLRRYWREWRDG
jgi:hypothetical protein